MNIFKALSLASSMLVALAVPAVASVTISSPTNKTEVTSPFTLTATAITCSSQTVSAIGYSLDNSRDTAIVRETYVKAEVVSPTGIHTLHVKAWGTEGALCVSDVTVTVNAGTTNISPPSDAVSVSNIETLSNWKAQHDPATPGSSTGYMSLVGTPAMSGSAREFTTKYSGSGGELYHISFGEDTTAKNFLYDTWIYIAGSSASLANLEMDMNQVIENGQVVIYGFQCDGWSGTWDYAENIGTPQHSHAHWLHSKAGCNPRNWSTNTWHHVQVQYSRTDSGVVTYRYVALDGVETELNVTVPAAFALGWAPTLVANFQVDGIGAGQTTIYMDKMTITRW
jgi:hypothetical protein